MAGQNADADSELNRFLESLAPQLEDFFPEHNQRVPAPRVDVQPDPAANGHALAGGPHQPMVVDLQQPAMQLPHQQAPPMINQQYPQPAPAMPTYHQKGLDESQVTMPRHPRHHMISELMLIRPPPYQQMQATMGDSSSAVPLQQQDMLAQGDPPQAVMTHQQMLVNAPAAYGGPHNDNIPMPSQGGGECQFFAAMDDGDFGLSAFRNEGEEEHLNSGGGNTGSSNASSISPVMHTFQHASTP
jgi:hypothetical protein